jgi:hypothetical protein
MQRRAFFVLATRTGLGRAGHLPRPYLVLVPTRSTSSLVEDRLAALEQRIADLERVAPAEFSLMHYNVLADKYGSNLQPWFLFGAQPPVDEDERGQLLAKFYERNAVTGEFANPGWPRWAEGLLSAERREQIEACHAESFDWGVRSHRLWARVEGQQSDLLTLAECDHYEDFWRERLRGAGYSSVWRKRPRSSSPDGCTIAWRNATFELIAQVAHR